MIRKIFTLLVICFACSLTVAAQNSDVKAIKQLPTTVDDLIPILESAGYEAFPFDLSSLNDGRYIMSVTIREYTDGKMTCEDVFNGYVRMPNMRLLSEFDEENQKIIKPEEMADAERGIYTQANKITIGFTPVVNDSIRPGMVNIENISSPTFGLPMKPQYRNNDRENGQKFYMYITRPFKATEFKTGEFIPLVLLGSAWYDPEIGTHRFCGENEIDPDMSSRILKYIPHYFVIGITCTLDQPLPPPHQK